MNSKFKRLLACLLSLMMVVSIFPMSAITASAAEIDETNTVSESNDEITVVDGGTWGGIDWTLTDDGTLTIAPTKGTPTKIANKKTEFKVGEWPEAVRYNSKGSGAAIEGWPYDRTKVKKLIIEEGVTSIGSFAVQSFTNLTGEVVIPSTVTYIGQEAFQNSTMTKLTFAEGGTEALTIAQGGLKDLIIEELTLPADRPAIHLKAWVFNNCDSLKHITLPANVKSIGGTNMVDYLYFSASHNSGNHSALTYYNDNLEAITFGSEAVRDLYFTTWGNPITTIGNKNSYKIAPTVANVGLTYATSLEAAARFAKSGDTITLLKDTDEVVELPAGVTLDTNGFTAANVTFAKPAVAQIGNQGFESLSAALAAAQAGDTITFVADITEDVTISKAITIDGAGKTYTGAMTLKADTTIKNVNFDGKGYNGYAITTRGANYLTIEDCTAKNYGFGFVQTASGTVLTTVKNVTVSNVNYGVKVDYSNAVVLENVDITAGVAAVLNSNYGEKTITIKNSKLNILGTWTRHNTTKTTYVFEGANTIDSFITDAAIDTFKLAVGATLTAPEGVTVTTDVDGKMVVYTNGTYELDLKHQGGTWGGIDWKLYEDGTLIIAPTKGTPVADKDAPTKRTYEVGEWRETVIYNSKGSATDIGGAPYNMKAVKKLIIEEGVTKIGSFTCQFPNLTGTVVIPSTVTYIGQEAFHKAPITELIFAESENAAAKLCIANGAFKKILIEEVVLPTDREEIHIHHWAFGGCPNLKTAFIPASGTKFWGGEHVDYFDNFNSQSNVTWAEYGSIFTGCTKMESITFETEAVRDLFFANGRQSTNEDYIVAFVGQTAYNTLPAAINAAQNGDTVKVINNVTLKDTLTIPAGKTITLDLNGKTISQSKACTASYEMINNKGNLTITGNGKITLTDTGAGDPNFGWGSYTIRNEGNLVVENGTIEFKGNQAFGTHCSLAIFQYSGSTTINGGKIVNNAYRSIRLWKGDVTINGGAFEGQVWVHCVDDSAKMTINGGSFAPAKNGGDGSSVFVNNSGKKAELTVTGGTFATKIGANDVAALAGAIAGGKFSEAAKNGTNAALLADNAVFGAVDSDGYYGIVLSAATVNGTNYATLADAIAAANAGDTVTLLADVNENVTINKNLTIDGADKNYTGTMTINNVTVTIKNVNFVKGQVYKNKSTGTNANVTIKNCNFDGQGMSAYAINLGGTNKIVIENVTAKDYGYGLLQVPSSCAGLTVKNVTISGCYYGLKVDYANAVTIENADIDATVGIYDSNYGTKTYTITNSKISTISIWQRNTTNYTTFKFEGVNEVATLSTSAYAKYTGVQVGTKIYDSLANAWAAAQDGDTIKLLGNIATSNAITNKKNVTLDLNGKTITGTDNATGSFGLITNKGELTITGNGKITLVATNNRGWNAYSSVISNTVDGKLIVENGTIEHLGGTDMAYGIDNLTNGKNTYAETIINGGTIKSTYRGIRQFLNGVEAQNILTVNGGVVEGANKSIWVQDPSKNNNTGKITVAAGAVLNGDVYLYATAGSAEWPVEVSIAVSAVNGEVITGNLPAGYILEKINGAWDVNKYSAKVGATYYETLAEAIAAAKDGSYVYLVCNVEGEGIVIDKNINIQFNGYTYTFVGSAAGSANTKTNGFQILKGNNVKLLNGTLKVADSAKDKYAMLIQNYANLTFKSMTLDGTNLDYSTKQSYTLSINCGNVDIDNNTTIIANDRDLPGDYAVDVYDYSSAGYSLPTLSIGSKATIDGKIYAAAKNGKFHYASLQQAIDAGSAAELLCDYEGKGVVLDKDFNLNLAGYTFTVTEGVGSANSKTNGFQILKGNKVSLRNGTIKVADSAKDKIAILVQNYADLTVSNVTLDGTNLDRASVSYVLSVNSGNVKVNAGSKIISNDRNGDNDWAIDVYDYSSAGYELPVVQIATDVTVDGVKAENSKKIHAIRYSNYYYGNLQQVIDKHGSAHLMSNFEGAGVVFNKSATIYFNGFTYTFTSGVGSAGTESNGFQNLKDNRLTLVGGTLEVADSAADKFYILVQNYGDLTLKSMTLDGTNLDKWALTDGDSYTLSNNSGNITIDANTTIRANDDGELAFAFDVCDQTAQGYELPLVKVIEGAKIEGNVEAAAKMGVRYYATLEQAIADRNNASSKDELVLMSNIVLKDTLVVPNCKAIVLDLNGFTISQEKACTAHYSMIVNNNNSLTIKDSVGGGKISFKDTGKGDANFGWGSYTIENKGQLILLSGTIENATELNTAEKNVHMYCAIQQNVATAHTQIRGGVVSTPTYRSIRINQGRLTINDGEIDGQVWAQPFAEGVAITINGGSFNPNGGDSSAIYIENSSKTVAFKIWGGSFEGKIGCANADALKGVIRAGEFTDVAYENTNATLFNKTFVR